MHKRDQLNKQKEGQGQWKDELASNSESIVRARPSRRRRTLRPLTCCACWRLNSSGFMWRMEVQVL